MTRIKICGITTIEDALAACRAGAHALGFNFSESSPRRIGPETARSITERMPPFVSAAGVFVEQTPEEIDEICEFSRLHIAQLHDERYGPEASLAITRARVLKVFRTGPGFSTDQVQRFSERTGIRDFLFDAYKPGQPGGTGVRIENETAQNIFRELHGVATATLAGGLKPENVGEAVRLLRPYAVDTASGVEKAPGVKDHRKIRSFVLAVQEADASETADS